MLLCDPSIYTGVFSGASRRNARFKSYCSRTRSGPYRMLRCDQSTSAGVLQVLFKLLPQCPLVPPKVPGLVHPFPNPACIHVSSNNQSFYFEIQNNYLKKTNENPNHATDTK